jgi:hypothetical protein
MKKETKKQLSDIEERLATSISEERLNRARSITTGTCGLGVTEICLRGREVLWIPLQPSEVTELIHQLAAGIGCHIHIQPRDDFASWRGWNEGSERLIQNKHPPFSNFPPHAKALIKNQPALMAKEIQDEQAVATEKTLKRRSTKRTAKTA